MSKITRSKNLECVTCTLESICFTMNFTVPNDYMYCLFGFCLRHICLIKLEYPRWFSSSAGLYHSKSCSGIRPYSSSSRPPGEFSSTVKVPDTTCFQLRLKAREYDLMLYKRFSLHTAAFCKSSVALALIHQCRLLLCTYFLCWLPAHINIPRQVAQYFYDNSYSPPMICLVVFYTYDTAMAYTYPL